MNKSDLTKKIKSKAYSLGFEGCGISKAQFLEQEAYRLEKWLKDKRHGTMKYMENYFDKRLDPRLLVDNAQSIISLTYNYFPPKHQKITNNYKVSKYAYGKDYHYVIKEKLNVLGTFIQNLAGRVNYRAFVDSAPVMDKVWAQKSGLAWMGKNANLITQRRGSFFFVAELIIDIELEEDGPVKDYCGSCTRCIDACPTDAIIDPYVVDGSKCISYFTIELKQDHISPDVSGKFNDWIFGCDICQDVCPWNRFSSPHSEPQFNLIDGLVELNDKKKWEQLTPTFFNQLFKESPLKRTRYKGLQRNIEFMRCDEKHP